MYEGKNEELAPFSIFLKRLGISLSIGLGLIVVALMIGTLGFHYIESLAWIDSFLNASLILSTMGPMVPATTIAGKLFSAFFALFSGLVFITIIAVIFAPIVHRFIHQFHAYHRRSH